MMRLAAVALLALGLAAPQGVTLQKPPTPEQQTPVFRSSINVVPLTLTVLDAKGNPITDLRQSEVTVFENGRQREIVNFFPQALVPGPVTPPPQPGYGARKPAGELTPETRRTFVIVPAVDYTYDTIEGGMNFIRSNLLPQDAVAVMAFHRVTPFTTDHERAAEILDRFGDKQRDLLFQLHLARGTSLFGNAGRPREANVYAAMDAVLAGIGPLRSSASLLLSMDRAVQVNEKPWERQERLDDVLRALEGPRGLPLDSDYIGVLAENGWTLDELVMRSNRFKLIAAVEYLRPLEGDKHLLFIGGSGLARNADDAELVARRATDARVTVHMISSGFSHTSRDVVDLTGGYYTSLEVANKALPKLDRMTRSSFLIGYTPFSSTLDGRYREISVKVSRPGATVRFRHGYYAAAEPDPLEMRDMIIKARLEAALAYSADAKDIKLEVQALVLPRMGLETRIRVQLGIDATNLGLPLKDGRHRGQLELRVYSGDEKQKVIGDYGESLTIEADEPTYQGFLKSGITHAFRVPVFGTPRFLKVVVYDYGSDRVGSFMYKIK